ERDREEAGAETSEDPGGDEKAGGRGGQQNLDREVDAGGDETRADARERHRDDEPFGRLHRHSILVLRHAMTLAHFLDERAGVWRELEELVRASGRRRRRLAPDPTLPVGGVHRSAAADL